MQNSILESSGLEGVVIGETRMSLVDGQGGQLIIAGEPVDQLAELGLAEVCTRLWRQPVTESELARGRQLGAELVPRLGDALDRTDGMDALRAAASHLPTTEPALITGALASFVAAWWSRQTQREPDAIPIAADQDHATDYLRMCTGRAPTPQLARAMAAYLATVSDHGMNASTFVARVVTSTASDPVSAVVAAIGALKGPLHGGAPGPVLDMLDAIGEPSAARGWLESELAAGRRIMGMGHRVYRVRDPRARVLQAAAQTLGGRRVELALAVEAAAQALLAQRYPGRSICANVEMYTAVLLDALGLDRRLFSATFAVGRVIGWLGHIAEQREHGRLIRPRAHYVGPGTRVRTSPAALAD